MFPLSCSRESEIRFNGGHARMKGRPIKDQRVDDLESAFRPLLFSCLVECGNGRWGLFGQNDSTEAANYLQWMADNTSKISLFRFALRERSLVDQTHSLSASCTTVHCAGRTFPANLSSPRRFWLKSKEVTSDVPSWPTPFYIASGNRPLARSAFAKVSTSTVWALERSRPCGGRFA